MTDRSLRRCWGIVGLCFMDGSGRSLQCRWFLFFYGRLRLWTPSPLLDSAFISPETALSGVRPLLPVCYHRVWMLLRMMKRVKPVRCKNVSASCMNRCKFLFSCVEMAAWRACMRVSWRAPPGAAGSMGVGNFYALGAGVSFYHWRGAARGRHDGSQGWRAHSPWQDAVVSGCRNLLHISDRDALL